MIQLRHNTSGERINTPSRTGYGPEWVEVGTLPPTASGDLSDYIATGGGVGVEDPVKVEARLLDAVKAEAERRKMLYYSPGGAKKSEYPKKQAEVAFFDSLGGTVAAALAALSLMSPTMQQAKFPYALASARRRREPNIVSAIERFRAGMRRSSPVEDIAAEEEMVCDAIKVAATASAKRAAAAAVKWP